MSTPDQKREDERMYFGELIKQFSVKDVHRFQPKGDVLRIVPIWRASILLNGEEGEKE